MPFAYLDHAASTPMRPEAVAAMVDAMERAPGNPSGSHRWAREARRLLDDARDVVAELVGCEPGEVVFTSGGTEADNLAITGIAAAAEGRPACLATDHHAALGPVLAAGGATLRVLPDGRADPDALADMLRGDAGPAGTADYLEHPVRAEAAPIAVVSMALVNNETGVVQDVASLADVVHSRSPGTALHLDAVAAAAWLDLLPAWSVAQALSISGHKVGGPKGIGALIVRNGTPLLPGLRGGPQERERRAGTPNVAGAVGLAAALVASTSAREFEVMRLGTLRDRLAAGLLTTIDGAVLTGFLHGGEGDDDRVQASDSSTQAAGSPSSARHVANIVHLLIAGVDREPLLFLLDEAGVAASAGSSCASGASEPSHVLSAMEIAPGLAAGALRLSLGWSSTDSDVDLALRVVPEVITRLREDGRSVRLDGIAPRRLAPVDHQIKASRPSPTSVRVSRSQPPPSERLSTSPLSMSTPSAASSSSPGPVAASGLSSSSSSQETATRRTGAGQ